MAVLVTGASGFIGQHLARELARRGRPIMLVDRNASSEQSVDGAHWHRMSVTSSTDWGPVTAAADIVVHLADGSRVFESHPRAVTDDQLSETVAATINLARQAHAAGARLFIYLSSIKAVTGEWSRDIIDEETPPEPRRSPYGLLKERIEKSLIDLASTQNSMRIVIMRPPMVYGPGSAGNLMRLVGAAYRGAFLPLAGFRAQRSHIYVGNLCDAIATVLEADAPVAGVYFVRDAEEKSVAEFVHMARTLGERNAVGLSLPKPLVWMAERAPVLRDRAVRLSRPLVVSDEKFRSAFGWQPPFDTRDALKLSLS